MRRSTREALLLLALLSAAPASAGASVREDIAAALTEVSRLRPMRAGRRYTLPAGGQPFTGTAADFARRRTPEEILESGLSSGSGDHAAAFYALVRKRGHEAAFVDSVELSLSSLLDRSSGHCDVGVRDQASGRWLLVDPENRKILSEGWSPAARAYRGAMGRYFAGYVGPLEEYPFKTPEAVRTLYDRTLRSVPTQVLDESLVRIEVAPAPGSEPDAPAPDLQLAEYGGRLARLYELLGLHPKRTAVVRLSEAPPGTPALRCDPAHGEWACPVRRDAGFEDRLRALERSLSPQLDKDTPWSLVPQHEGGTPAGPSAPCRGAADCFNAAGRLANDGDCSLAAALFGKSIEYDPGNPWAWWSRSILRKELGDAAGAKADLERALALEPKWPDFQHRRKPPPGRQEDFAWKYGANRRCER